MKNKRNKRFLSPDVQIFIVVFTTSAVSAKTIAYMDLSPNSPKTHQNVKHSYFNVYSRKKNTKDLAVWASPFAFHLYGKITKKN
jgi:hypothetical protein